MSNLKRALLLSVALWISFTDSAAAATAGDNALTNLTRGAINVLTGWVEVPKNIGELKNQAGWGAALTWGFARGIGYGFVRTVAGAYEVLTFPFPAPPGYQPVMQPEFVFDETHSDAVGHP